MFTIVSCFEVALRNAIDSLLVPTLGEDWLKDSVQDNGIFNELDKVNSLIYWYTSLSYFQFFRRIRAKRVGGKQSAGAPFALMPSALII